MGAAKARAAFVADRRAKAINLRIAGVPWAPIAERLGYSNAAAACRDVSRALDKALLDQSASVDQYRQLNTMRLERLLTAVMPAATATAASGGPSMPAVAEAIRIINSLSKLQGLEHSTKVDLNVLTIDVLDQAIIDLQAQVALTARQVEDAEWDDEQDEFDGIIEGVIVPNP